MTTAEKSPAVGSKTPPRNNYAHPHTPIMSIKRPRNSLESSKTKLSPLPVRTPRGSDSPAAEALSPMHPPKAATEDSDASWVGRKVDALFSPVLSFLNQAQSNIDTPPTATSSSSCSSADPVPKETETHEEEEDDFSCEDSLASINDTTPDDEFNPWQFIKSLPDYRLVSHLCPPVTLPPKRPEDPPLTLVLDLDETLVHCTVEPVANPDLIFPVQFHGTEYTVHVRIRPYLTKFLRKASMNYEVIVFTASQKVYANELLNRIDPENKYIRHRLFRESCLPVEGNYLKDLHVLGRDLATTILVDNSPHAFGYQVDNGIPIESWFDDDSDKELLKLDRFLGQIRGVTDVRPAIRRKFKSHQLVANAADY